MTVAIDLDVLGDTRPLWRDWLADAARVLDVDGLPEDRAAAAAELDARGAGNWRTLLERFAEERAPVYLRPGRRGERGAARAAGGGARLVVFTDAPPSSRASRCAQLGAAGESRASTTEPPRRRDASSGRGRSCSQLRRSA